MKATPPTPSVTRSPRRAAPSQRGALSLPLVLVLLAATLLAGLVAGRSPSVQRHLPAWVIHLEGRAAPASGALSSAGTGAAAPLTLPVTAATEPAASIQLRAGRHPGFDRLVVDGAGDCDVDDRATSNDHNGTEWLRISCSRSLADLVLPGGGPSSAGLRDVVGWTVSGDHLLVRVLPWTSASACGVSCGPSAIDVVDAGVDGDAP